MTKHELVKLFPNFSPKRAFRPGDGGFEVVGKYVSAVKLEGTLEDGTEVWDVFVCNVEDMASGLTQHRTNALYRLFPEKRMAAQLLDGEAWFQSDFVTCKQWLEANRKRLRITKRKRTVSNLPQKSILSSQNRS